MVYRRWARHRSHIQEDTHIGLENGAKGVEEPPMGVDLLLVKLLEAEDDLHRDGAALRAFDLHGGGYGDWRRGYISVVCERDMKRGYFGSCTRRCEP